MSDKINKELDVSFTVQDFPLKVEFSTEYKPVITLHQLIELMKEPGFKYTNLAISAYESHLGITKVHPVIIPAPEQSEGRATDKEINALVSSKMQELFEYLVYSEDSIEEKHKKMKSVSFEIVKWMTLKLNTECIELDYDNIPKYEVLAYDRSRDYVIGCIYDTEEGIFASCKYTGRDLYGIEGYIELPK